MSFFLWSADMVARLLKVRRRFPVAFFVLFTWNVELLQTLLSSLFVINELCFLTKCSFLLGNDEFTKRPLQHEWTEVVNEQKNSASVNEKNSVFNPSKYFVALKKVNLSILSTFERSFSKKLGKTPTSHIIHSLGVEYCWIVHDSEPIKLLKSPRSLSGYILIWNIRNLSFYLAVRSTCDACAARATNRNKPHLTQNPLISYEERLPLKTSALQFFRVVDWP